MLRYITLNITFRSLICSILLALSFSFAQTLEVTMTAYSSEAAQTDGTPTITATGEEVGPGVVAVSRDLLNDELPYGTELRVVEVNSEANACGGWNPRYGPGGARHDAPAQNQSCGYLGPDARGGARVG